MAALDPTTIPDTPLERVPQTLRAKLENNEEVFFDVHTHFFNYKDVPEGFLNIRVPITKRVLGSVSRFLRKIARRFGSKAASNYGRFINTLRSKNSETVFRLLDQHYQDHPHQIYSVLTMDMDPGIKARAKRSFLDQVKDIAELRDRYPNHMLPFLNLDPSRNDALSYFQRAFDFQATAPGEKLHYFGFKVYPCLAYLPSNPVLMQIYKVCAAKRIPVLTHCSSALTCATGRRQNGVEGTYVDDQRKQHQGPHNFKARRLKRRQDYRSFFNRPQNWIPVLEAYPDLNLNIAHFGGNTAWEEYCDDENELWVNTIIDLMHQYDHVYADFSFTMFYPELAKRLKKLMLADAVVASRVLFGSDSFMLDIKGDYGQIFKRFKGIMGDDLMHQMAVVNAKRHLFGF